MNARVLIANLHLGVLLTIASTRRQTLTVSQLLAEPAGHRVTLTRRRLIGRPLVIRTNANPTHADALRDLRAMFATYTGGGAYIPRRGDILTHEVTK